MEGVKISNLEALKALEISPTEVASKIIHAYCKQIFLDGVYHADPHPGNFLVQPGPKIIMMDFGAVARISDRMRKGTAKFIEGVIRRDHHIISQSMKEMGFISKSQNEEVFDRIVDFFYDRLKDIKMEDVKDLNLSQLGKLEDLIEFKKLDISFKDLLETFNVPKDWALMERAFILIFALTTHLDSKLNPLSIIIPYAEKFVLGSDKTVGDLIVEGVKETGLSYLKLPNELLRTLKRLNQGEIEFRTKNQSTETGPIALALKRLQSTLLFIASLAMTYLLYKEQIPEYRYALYSSAVFAVWWMFTQLKKS
ncbi:MAG: AarF/ABC1/UbiB kinase family protein, partial [Deltaproteobacteria bacterium]|nr:AarF/ABC1/UbiB kinase family protein [Deltaproteobacteria bacterium]